MLFSEALVSCIGFVIIKRKIEGQTIYRNPHAAKLQNSNQIQPYPGLAKSGYRSSAFRVT